jgi:parvulin-like peptidyl-prolyl isomerase
VLAVQPGPDVKVDAPTEADLQRVYEQYKSRFTSGPRVQLEYVRVPKQYGEDELRAARETAQSLVDRARRGEPFEDLARDFSEGPNAEQGGLIPRPITPQEFGPELGAKLEPLKSGEVLDPFVDAGRVVVLKVVERLAPGPGGAPSMRVAQIVIKARPNEDTLRQQYDELKKLRDQATRVGLGQAATTRALATSKTSFYDANNAPPELFTAPEAAEWGLGAKRGAVSPVFDGLDELVVAQVSARHEGGPASREEIAEPLRQIAELEARVTASKPRADAVAGSLASGASLEQAAKANGLEAARITGMTRSAPDPRIAAAPEALGALLAAKPGQVIGPVRAVNGWYFARLDGVAAPAESLYVNNRRQLTTEILQRRQQSFFMGLTSDLRARADVKDLRTTFAY